MDLAVPLYMSQIEAANKLHRQLPEWQVTDGVLHYPLSCTNRKLEK
jgi:hypothetical protein